MYAASNHGCQSVFCGIDFSRNILQTIRDRDARRFLEILDDGVRSATRMASEESHALGLQVVDGRARSEGELMKQSGSGGNLDDSPAKLGAPALQAFFQLATVWHLTEREQMKLLGLSSQSTIQSWKADHLAEVRHETIQRISYLLGIFKAINILLPEQTKANAWVRAPNTAPLFGGRSALDHMTSGDVGDLAVVRQYLDSQLS